MTRTNQGVSELCAKETVFLLHFIFQLLLKRKVQLQLGVALEIVPRFRPTGMLFGKGIKEKCMRRFHLLLSLVPGFCIYGSNIYYCPRSTASEKEPNYIMETYLTHWRQLEAEL